jgi:hypothetical protein
MSAHSGGGKAAPRWAARMRPGRLPAVERPCRPGLDAAAAHARLEAQTGRVDWTALFALGENVMIRKMKTGEYRLYSRKKSPKTGKRRNLGTFASRQAAEKHERAVQFFKRGG